MSRKEQRFKRLGLSFFMVAVAMAIMAATVLAEWSVEEETLKEMEVGRTEVGVEASAVGELSLLVPSENLVIHCKKTASDVGRILQGNELHGTLLISECTTLINGKTSSGCKPEEPIIVKGTGLLILHEGKTFILFEPISGKPFAQLSYNEKECALPSKPTITGSFVAECKEPTLCETESVSHSLSPASVVLFGSDKLKYGLKEATLDGTVALKLNGEVVEEDKGKKWSAKG